MLSCQRLQRQLAQHHRPRGSVGLKLLRGTCSLKAHRVGPIIGLQRILHHRIVFAMRVPDEEDDLATHDGRRRKRVAAARTPARSVCMCSPDVACAHVHRTQRSTRIQMSACRFYFYY